MFASSYPALHGALTLDAGMARAPMLVGSLCLLLAGTGRRLSRGLRVAGIGVWLLCTFAEPAVLCVLPGMVLFLYLAESGRPACGPLATWAAIAGGLLFGTLLAASGVTAAGVAAAHPNPPRVILQELGALGLAFVAAGAMRLGGRPTRGELLLWTSGCAGVAWMLGADAVDTRGLATVLLLTVPLVGYGMNAALRSRPGRRHAWVVGLLSLLLPASGLAGAVPQLAELREDRSRRLGSCRRARRGPAARRHGGDGGERGGADRGRLAVRGRRRPACRRCAARRAPHAGAAGRAADHRRLRADAAAVGGPRIPPPRTGLPPLGSPRDGAPAALGGMHGSAGVEPGRT